MILAVTPTLLQKQNLSASIELGLHATEHDQAPGTGYRRWHFGCTTGTCGARRSDLFRSVWNMRKASVCLISGAGPSAASLGPGSRLVLVHDSAEQQRSNRHV